MTQATYRTLEESLHEIRLLELLPTDTFGAPLSGCLTYHILDDAPLYEGLSYAWGNPVFSQSIELDGRLLHITENLDAALRHIRLPATSRLLWMDAICINQQDIQERSHQVTLMKKIYETCAADLLWIGPDPSDERTEDYLREGVQLMEKISSKNIHLLNVRKKAYETRYNDDDDLFWQMFSGMISPEEALAGELDDDPDPEMLSAASHGTEDLVDEEDEPHTRSKGGRFFLTSEETDRLRAVVKDASVWNRVWVMQELSCAPRIVIMAGRSRLDWELITQFLGDQPYADAFHHPFSHGMAEVASTVFETVQTIEHQRRIIRDVANGEGSKLLDVLSRFGYAKASDPRDKVYGLLGLVSDIDIDVSYAKTIPELLINKSHNLDMICQSPWRILESSSTRQRSQQESRVDTEMEALPSWVADFRFKGRVMLFAGRSIFNAGRVNCTTPCRIIDGGVLRTSGVLLGRLGPILQDDYHACLNADPFALQPRIRKQKTIVQEWMELYFGKEKFDDPEATYINGEQALTAFWRALVTDRTAYPMKRLTEVEIAAVDTVLRQNNFCPSAEERVFSHSIFKGLPTAEIWQEISTQLTFALTDNGLYTMIAPPAMDGDFIACLDGGKVPVVLRLESGSDPVRYKIVSVAYVHGFMDMEAFGSTLDSMEQEILLS